MNNKIFKLISLALIGYLCAGFLIPLEISAQEYDDYYGGAYPTYEPEEYVPYDYDQGNASGAVTNNNPYPTYEPEEYAPITSDPYPYEEPATATTDNDELPVPYPADNDDEYYPDYYYY